MGEAEVTKPGNNHPFFGCTYRRYLHPKEEERLGIRQGWLGKAQFHSFLELNCDFFLLWGGTESLVKGLSMKIRGLNQNNFFVYGNFEGIFPCVRNLVSVDKLLGQSQEEEILCCFDMVN